VSVPEYLLSISDTSETLTYMETAFPDMALVHVPSTLVTKSQNVLLTSAEPSLSTLRILLLFDTSLEEIASSGLSKISPRPEILRKCSTEKITTLFLITEEANTIFEEKRKKQRGNKVKKTEKSKM